MIKDINLDIPFFSQYSGEIINKKYWSRRICWLSCIKMFIHYSAWQSPSYNELITNENKNFICLSLLDWKEKQYKYFTEKTWWIHYALISIIRQYWYNWTFFRKYIKDNIIEELYNQLSNWYFIIASLNRYPEYKWVRRWHLVVVKWIETINKQIYIIINDPARKHWNTKMRFETFKKNFNNVSILLKKEPNEKFLSNYPIYIDTTCKNKNWTVFVHVHENEITARNTTLEYIEKKWWELISIHQNNERFLRYEILDALWNEIFLRIDPNRIFTDEWLKKTIIERNLHLSNNDLDKTFIVWKYIREYILSKIDENVDIIVWIHNNKFLDINSFKTITPYIYVNKNLPNSCFIQTVNIDDFEKISKIKMNCLFFPMMENDWWLADYYLKKWKRYFTIETSYEDKELFAKMLDIINEIK